MNSSVLAILAVAGFFAILTLLAVAVFYVLSSVSHMKALKALGYDKPWLAWVPGGNLYAVADAALNGDESIMFFGSFVVPAAVFRFWWAIALVLMFVPIIGNLCCFALFIICLGTCYTRLYARLEYKSEQDTMVIGFLSGLFPIIAVCKFLVGKYQCVNYSAE